jgi:hypothetical protein
MPGDDTASWKDGLFLKVSPLIRLESAVVVVVVVVEQGGFVIASFT